MQMEAPATIGRQLSVKSALRWIVLFPGAIVCGWLAHMFMQLANRLSMLYIGVNPDGFLAKIFIELVSTYAMFGAFVIVGQRIAPSRKKEASYALTVIALIGCGFLAFPAVMVRNYWALLGISGGIVGAISAQRSLLSEEASIDNA